MDDAFRKAKRQYEADPKNPDTQQQYCRAYARAGYPGQNPKKCLAPWCGAATKKHQLCIHHRKPIIYDALGLPPKLEFPEDWHYLVECAYDTEYSCDASGCDSICRCGVLVGTRVESIDPASITRHLVSNTGQFGPKTLYALERVVARLLRPDDFEVYTQGGYYGEEIGSVRLTSDALQKEAVSLLNLPPDEQIRRALVLEYGDLLPSLQKCSFDIQSIDVGRITYSKEQMMRAEKDPCTTRYRYDFMHIREAPIMLVLQEEDSYRLIDGYHRFAGWKSAYLGPGVTIPMLQSRPQKKGKKGKIINNLPKQVSAVVGILLAEE